MPQTPATQLNELLLTKQELMQWLRHRTDYQIRGLLEDPAFVDRCAVDVARPGSKRHSWRFSARAVAAYLGVPADATPQLSDAA